MMNFAGSARPAGAGGRRVGARGGGGALAAEQVSRSRRGHGLLQRRRRNPRATIDGVGAGEGGVQQIPK